MKKVGRLGGAVAEVVAQCMDAGFGIADVGLLW